MQLPTVPEAVTRSSRALQATSGNTQPYNLENLKPEEVKTQSGDVHLSLDFHPQHYPLPLTLQSNAPRPISATQHLEQQRLHRTQVAARQVSTQATVGAARSSGPVRRGYLNSRRYLEYRARPRRDTGKDREPVWPDELEEVFQDGQYIFSRYCSAVLTTRSAHRYPP
jgi:transcriptional enhancer factor